ncbi:MAG: spore cortex-lytic protein, partial [Clostridia bacterium]|nr:spore cortex-lytic protein [Clostridia bacterium]
MPFTPTVPEQIVIHLGSPDSDAQNVTETFPDYIKNVASSEIYPTWPEAALRANILAQISVAMNRVYTGFYRNRGYDFDITSSPAYDQTYVYGRDIFSNISEIVDEIFNSYIRREGTIEPLFTEFCDGIEVQCNGLYQWGSVELAERGLDYFSILQNYYGNDIELVTDAPVANRPGTAPPVVIREGDTGRDVEILQRRL